MENISGTVFDIKELTVHDGPGVRATVFMKGCPLRCLWCHNPEGISPYPQLMIAKNGCTGCGQCRIFCGDGLCEKLGRCAHRCPNGLLTVAGKNISAREIAEKMHRLAPLLTGGGVTVSGGEPLAQPAFLLALLALLKPLHTVVETSGYAKPEVFRAAAEACDIVYLDIKHPDSATHQKLTGVGNEPIMLNLEWLKKSGRPFVVRIPLIPGCNGDAEALTASAGLLAGAEKACGVELLPMNPFTAAKYRLAGMDYPLTDMAEEAVPSVSPQEAAEIFTRRGFACRVL